VQYGENGDKVISIMKNIDAKFRIRMKINIRETLLNMS